jgi:thioredoxin 1
MNGKTVDVNFANFEAIVDGHPIVVLDFWAAWCAPCRIFAPVFEKLAELHPDVYFGKVNTEIATDLAQAFQIRGIPTLMVFLRGELVFEQPGLVSAEGFTQLLGQLRAKASTENSK